MNRKRLGVLISGRGSNLQALIDAAADPDYPAEVALVISDQPDAYGLERAAKAGIPSRVIERRDFADKAGFETEIDRALRDASVDIVCLAGFMRLLSDLLVDRWQGHMLNIHPSLLPAFKGLNAQAQALAAGVRIAGCTVHMVTHEMDGGPVMIQAAVPVLPDDTDITLAARILTQEHRIYPAAVRLLADGSARLDATGKLVLEGVAAGHILADDTEQALAI